MKYSFVCKTRSI